MAVLRDEGYHRCSVDRISRLAGCSRVSFYQYFSGKEDVFYRLTGVVAAEVQASIAELDVLTADARGRENLWAWVGRESEIYRRYGPVFNTYVAAAAGIDAVAELGKQAIEANIAGIRSRLGATTVPTRDLKAVIGLLFGCVARTMQLSRVLRAAVPDAYPPERIDAALTDVLHRTLFGRDDDVNVHPCDWARPPRLDFAPSSRQILRHELDESRHGSAQSQAQPTLQALLAAGREVFVSRGYAGARIDDIVAAAGVSHGTFYEYFKNKNDLAHVLVLDAMQPLGDAFSGMPAAPEADGPALRQWLRVYNARHVDEAALIRVWVDAQAQGATLGADAAPALDWGRRRVANFLRPRGFGDVDAEALVMVALLDAFGSHVRSGRVVDAVAHILERGLLGR